MWDVLYAFGRGLIKFLVALFIGVGVGLVTIGSLAIKDPTAWDFHHQPPFGPLLLGIGAGLLTAGGVLFVLIFIPWPRRRSVVEHAPSLPTEPMMPVPVGRND